MKESVRSFSEFVPPCISIWSLTMRCATCEDLDEGITPVVGCSFTETYTP